MGKSICTIVLVTVCCLLSQFVFADTYVTVGSGGAGGVYNPIGKAICRMVNQGLGTYDLLYRCKESKGSVDNIKAVMNGRIELGLAQSDRQYQAYNGLAEWRSSGSQKRLRSVFSLHSEIITLIASQKSHIKSLDDLKGKRINIGHRGSGQHKNSMDVLGAVGINLDTVEIKQINAVKNQKLMQGDKIDAFFYTVGHPNKSIGAISKEMDIAIIPITGVSINALIEKYPYYTNSQIPVEFYPFISNKTNIDSIGVTATLITSSDINKHVVYVIVKEIFDNLNRFRKLHPALRHLRKENMLKGLTAPIHEGAMLYYREAGLIKYPN